MTFKYIILVTTILILKAHINFVLKLSRYNIPTVWNASCEYVRRYLYYIIGLSYL